MPLSRHCSEIRKSAAEVQVFPAARFSDLKAASEAMRVIADGWDMILPEVGPGRRREELKRAGCERRHPRASACCSASPPIPRATRTASPPH